MDADIQAQLKELHQRVATLEEVNRLRARVVADREEKERARVVADREEKELSLEKAADQGDQDAQYELGRWYARDWGVEKDLKEAVKWCQKAADQGHQGAESKLRYDYYQNRIWLEWSEVYKDFNEAEKWYQKAADQGEPFKGECIFPFPLLEYVAVESA